MSHFSFSLALVLYLFQFTVYEKVHVAWITFYIQSKYLYLISQFS